MEKHQTKIESLVHHHVDNMTLVRRMLAHNNQNKPSQKETLKSDIEVQLQIKQNMDTLYLKYHTSTKTSHVKAPQDVKQEKPLTWKKT